MEKQLILEIEQAMLASLDNAQMKLLHEVLNHCLWKKTVTEQKEHSQQESITNTELMGLFLSSKRVEGCSEKTLKYYKATIGRLLANLSVHITHVTTDDLRKYLADYQENTPRKLRFSLQFYQNQFPKPAISVLPISINLLLL